VAGNGDRRVIIVQKMCARVCKCKIDTFESSPGIGGGGYKRELWRG
jgi:hypothetical protein